MSEKWEHPANGTQLQYGEWGVPCMHDKNDLGDHSRWVIHKKISLSLFLGE